MPVNVAEVTPWAEVHVDLIGPYTINTQKLDAKGVPITLSLTEMTFIDPSKGDYTPVDDNILSIIPFVL